MSTIKITTSDKAFQDWINRSIFQQLNSSIVKIIPIIKNEIGELCAGIVKDSPEVLSILNGTLRAELGFISPDYIVKNLLDKISESVYVEFLKFNSVGAGSFNIGIIKGDYSDLLSMDKASYESNGFQVDWLKWLLFEDSNTIISNYTIEYNLSPSQRQRSRSKQAIMVAGNGYRIPSEYAGNQKNNFITRSLEPRVAKIFEVVTSHIENNFYT